MTFPVPFKQEGILSDRDRKSEEYGNGIGT